MYVNQNLRGDETKAGEENATVKQWTRKAQIHASLSQGVGGSAGMTRSGMRSRDYLDGRIEKVLPPVGRGNRD
jgi:hypothetical protein